MGSETIITIIKINSSSSSCPSCETNLPSAVATIGDLAPASIADSNASGSELPLNAIETVQRLTSKFAKLYSLYQPELHFLGCLLKYFKIFNLVSFPVEAYWASFNRFLANIITPQSRQQQSSSTQRSFYPYTELQRLQLKTAAPVTLLYCTKVYVFSFLVRFLEIFYII